VNAIWVPSLDQTVSNSWVVVPKLESWVVVPVPESHTKSCQHGDEQPPVGTSRTNASFVPAGFHAGARSCAVVWIDGSTAPDPGAIVKMS
jgi:hypothetical protein